MWLGAHIGIAGGLADVPSLAHRIGCESIQIFSKSPQMWQGPPIPVDAAAAFVTAVKREKIRATAIHHGYLANLASPKLPMLERSRTAFLDELERARLLGVDALIFHPGAHLGSGIDTGISTLVESLNWAIDRTPENPVRILLENAAGQGTTIGSTLHELRRALDGVVRHERVGVAIDTCHLFAAGTDLRTPELYAEWMETLDRELGRREVQAFHLNDAKAPLGSHLDRHENIGKGEIGTAGFRGLMNDRRWANVPGYLETPLDENGYDRYAADLTTLRGLLGAGGSTARRRTAAANRREPRGR